MNNQQQISYAKATNYLRQTSDFSILGNIENFTSFSQEVKQVIFLREKTSLLQKLAMKEIIDDNNYFFIENSSQQSSPQFFHKNVHKSGEKNMW